MTSRTTLKTYFKKGAIPKESEFAELIDSMVVHDEDSVLKLPNSPLSIKAIGNEEALLNFYRVDQGQNTLTWQLKQKPGNVPGLSIHDGTQSRWFIASDTGNVGLGTTAPTARLDIKATSTSTPLLNITDSAGTNSWLYVQGSGNVGLGTKSPTARLDIKAASASTPVLNITDSAGTKSWLYVKGDGNVGLGTKSPTAWLDIVAVDSLVPLLNIANPLMTMLSVGSTGKVGIGTKSPAAQLDIKSTSVDNRIMLQVTNASSTKLLTVGSDGNVGLGTESPAARLEIKAVSTSTPLLNITDSAGTKSWLYVEGSGNVGLGTNSPAAQLDIKSTSLGPTTLLNIADQSGTNLLTVGSDGNVGLGTNSPTAKLDVRGDIRLGTDGALYAPGVVENTRIIRGTVYSSGTIAAGQGFKVSPSENYAGVYVIQFSPAFTDRPTVVATVEGTILSDTRENAIVIYVTATDCMIRCGNSTGGGAKQTFHFIAIGQR